MPRVDRAEQRAERDLSGTGLRPADRLLDLLIRNHALLLAAGEANIRRARARLERMAKQLEAALVQGVSSGDITKRERDRILAELRVIRQRGTEQYGKAIDRESQKLTRTRLTADRRALVGVGVAFDQGLSVDQIAVIGRGEIVRGDRIDRWFRRDANENHETMVRQIRLAFAEGASIPSMVRIIRDQGEKDRRRLEALARTVTNAYANEAANRLYDRNSDVLTGKQWVATLDDRTCRQCGPLDGRVWYYGNRTPSVATMPKAPRHVNCRCFVAPVVRGLSTPNVPTWSEWIVRQDEETQDAALGSPTLGRFMRSRKVVLKPSELTGRNGQPRTVAEITRMLREQGRLAV